MILRVPKEKIRKIDIINVRGGITASEVYKKYNPDYMINLALYDMASGENITNLKDEGVMSGYLFSDYGIGIKGENEIVFCHKDDTTVRDFVAGSPVLIENNKKKLDWGNKYSQYVDGVHKRSAIGFNSEEIILHSSDEKRSLKELSNVLECTCTHAINLQHKDKIYVKSSRKNVSWLLIYMKPEIAYIDYSGIPEVGKMRICLDAGHGKETAGKRSPDGSLLEYEFNRNVTDRIKTILEKYNVEVLLTCDDEHDIDLRVRCEYANANNCDYYVSIHANAHKEYWTDANGWEIHIVGKGGKAEKLAESIRKHSIPALGLKDRGIKVSSFQVLKDTDMPAVLIEHGFYTNKEECEKLKSDEFRQRCAIADAKGILEHLGIPFGNDIDVLTNDKVTDTNVGDLVLTIGQKSYTANGIKKESDVAPKIENGRTLVPIYLLRELGLNVEWKADTKQIIVNKE